MLDGNEIVKRLAAERAAGASRDELLRRAVEAIEAAEERYDWVGVYLMDRPGAGAGGADASEAGGRPVAAADPRPATASESRTGRELVLHNYIGRPTDHTRIAVGSGVCGTAVAEERDINVPDVDAIDNYLACSVETKSELVILIRDPGTGEIYGQLDLDSDRRAAFGERDERELKVVADWLGELFG